jgi:hypothetical protein
MFWLGLIGLGLAIGGGIMSMVGQAGKNKAEMEKAKRMKPVYEAQQAAIQAQLAQIGEEKQQAKDINAINKKQLAIQGLNVSEQGAQAIASTKTSAAVGNLGGVSVLRQAEMKQTQLDRAMSGIAGEGQKLDIQLTQQETALNVAQAGASANLLQSQVNELNNETDIQFLQDYGWMSVAAVGINSAASVIKIASGIPDVGTGTGITMPAVTKNNSDWMGFNTTSLATENFAYAGSNPYSGGYY